MDSKLAVHYRIRVGADLRGAHGVTEAGRGGPRKIDHVLPPDAKQATAASNAGKVLCVAAPAIPLVKSFKAVASGLAGPTRAAKGGKSWMKKLLRK